MEYGGEEEEEDGLGFDPIAAVEAAIASGAEVADEEEEVESKLSVLRSQVPRERIPIDHLPDAFQPSTKGEPVLAVGVGDRIVIERFASVLRGNPYLDTRLYVISEIDEDARVIKLWDPELRHHARENWSVGTAAGNRYKVPPKRGRWDVAPRVIAAPPPNAAPVPVGPDGEPLKRKRGRPKGSSNRPKEEIAKEKVARAAARAEKKARRARK